MQWPTSPFDRVIGIVGISDRFETESVIVLKRNQ